MLGGCVSVAEQGKRLGAGGEAGRSGAPARRAHPPAATPPRAPPPPALRAPAGWSGHCLLLFLLLQGARSSRGGRRARVAGLCGRPGTAGDTRARPGGARAVRSTGDSAPEPGARPGRAPPTPRRRLPLLPRASRSRWPRPGSTPTCFPPWLLLCGAGGSAALEAPRTRQPGTLGAPRRDALGRLRGIPGALLLPAVGCPGARPGATLTRDPLLDPGSGARTDRS